MHVLGEHITLSFEEITFLFESFGVTILRKFVLQDHANLVKKVIFNKKKWGNKITLGQIRENFPRVNYEILEQKQLNKLSTNVTGFFHFFVKFGKLHNICDNIKVYRCAGKTQQMRTGTCRIFQLYLFGNLFG